MSIGNRSCLQFSFEIFHTSYRSMFNPLFSSSFNSPLRYSIIYTLRGYAYVGEGPSILLWDLLKVTKTTNVSANPSILQFSFEIFIPLFVVCFRLSTGTAFNSPLRSSPEASRGLRVTRKVAFNSPLRSSVSRTVNALADVIWRLQFSFEIFSWIKTSVKIHDKNIILQFSFEIFKWPQG